MLQVIVGVLAFILTIAIIFMILSLAVWWLVPLAFPALSFGFTNAMALTGLGLLFAGLASSK